MSSEPDSAADLADAFPDTTSRSQRLALLLVVPLAVLFVAIVAVFYVFFSAVQVEGPSMVPTLRDKDKLLVTHGESSASRGDIIAVRTMINGQPDEIIKRVIALPGDTIEIRGDVAYVNGVREPERGQFIRPDVAVDVRSQVVPEGTLYVMGDNRAVSEDSRYIGPVAQSGVVGRAVVIFAPFYRIGILR